MPEKIFFFPQKEEGASPTPSEQKQVANCGVKAKGDRQ